MNDLKSILKKIIAWQELHGDYLSITLVILISLSLTSVMILIPLPWPDEPIFFEGGINMISTGKATTDLYGVLYPEMAQHSLAYTPYYFVVLGAWIGLVGDSLWLVRFSSVLLGIATLVVFYYLLQHITKSKVYALVGALILACNFEFIKGTHLLRMEILLLYCFIQGIYLYHRSLTIKAKIISTIFFSVCPMIHPIGLCALAAGGILILFDQLSLKTKIALVSLMSAFTTIQIVIWLFLVRGDHAVLLDQLDFQLIRKANIDNYVLNLLVVPEFKYIVILAVSLVAIFGLLIMASSRFRPNAKYFFLALSTIILTLMAKEMWYVVFMHPFIIILAIIITQTWYHTKKLYGHIAVTFFILLPFFFNAVIVNREYQDKKNFDYPSVVRQIKSQIPDNSIVCLSSIPDLYFGLQNTSLQLREFIYVPHLEDKITALLNSCNYLIYNVDFNYQIKKYALANLETSIEVAATPTTTVHLIKFRPKDQRVSSQ